MIREVVRLPAAALKEPAAEVDPADPAVVTLAADLVETMRASAACVGLAANQAGVPWRVCCLDVTGHRKAVSCHGLVVMVNPRIVASAGGLRAREGCLSVPDFTGDVTRPETVTVEWEVPGSGEVRRLDADGIEARCVLHEVDHLAGLLFLDRVSTGLDVFPRRRYR